MESPSELLRCVNANNYEVLYRCRWSKETAEATVPLLAALLSHDDPELVAETLRALHRIASSAFSASPAIKKILRGHNPMLRQLAASTLGRVCLEHPDEAVSSLVAAAEDSELVEAVLFALINFGRGAAPAAPLFARVYESRSAKLRRLAVRALLSAQASDPGSLEVLRRAESDPHGEVRRPS